MELGLIPTDDFARFVRERFESSGRAIELEALGRLIALDQRASLRDAAARLLPLGRDGRRRHGDTRPRRPRARPAAALRARALLAASGRTRSRDQRLLLLALAVEPGRPFTGRLPDAAPPAGGDERPACAGRADEARAGGEGRRRAGGRSPSPSWPSGSSRTSCRRGRERRTRPDRDPERRPARREVEHRQRSSRRRSTALRG